MKTKTCRQCGEVRPLAHFRPYYKGSGTYTICRDCERLNSREKYLYKKPNRTDEENEELDKIYTVYELQRAQGLRPPGTQNKPKLDLDSLIEKFSQVTDLEKWLTYPLVKEPDYYLDETTGVYAQLEELYRPMIDFDQDTMLPIYETKHMPVLNKILERFYRYEEEYYGNN